MKKTFFKNVFLLNAGAVIYASSIAMLLDPNSLAPGGISGISIILSKVLPIPVGLLIVILNVPMFIMGIIKLRKRFMFYTLYASLASSVIIDVIGQFPDFFKIPLTDDPLLAGVFGGALMGAGIGIIMRAGGSTGGTDIIIRILRMKFKEIKTGYLYLLTDSSIIAVSALVFKDIEVALYAGISLVVCSAILDIVLYGRDEAKLLIIVSEKHKEITEKLLTELETGATYLMGEGAYSGENKKVLMCALKKHSFTRAREIIRDIDPDAFLIVSSASEIFGEGYKEHYGEDI